MGTLVSSGQLWPVEGWFADEEAPLDVPSETTGEAQERSPLCDRRLSKHDDVGRHRK